MSFEMPPDWCVFGLDDSWTGEVRLQGYSQGGGDEPSGWRSDHVTIQYGRVHDHQAPSVHVVSAPRLGESALRMLHTGLSKAGFEFGMSGTGHVSGAPVAPDRTTVSLEGDLVAADVWRGAKIEVAWVETADSWIAVAAPRVQVSSLGLTRIRDLGPLLAARNR